MAKTSPLRKSGSDSNLKQNWGPDPERAFEFQVCPLRRQNDQMLCFRARYGVEVQPSIKTDIAALVAYSQAQQITVGNLPMAPQGWASALGWHPAGCSPRPERRVRGARRLAMRPVAGPGGRRAGPRCVNSRFALAGSAGLWGQMYAADIKGGLPEHRPGETAARPADTGALPRTFRAPVHGADPVPPAVLLVRRSDHGGRPVRRKLPGDRPVQALNAR